MNILLADDHDLVRETIRFYLEQLDPGVNVTEAGTLPEALEAAAGMPGIDLIILDYQMPGMNRLAGLDLMRQRFPGVPVVILSAFVGPEEASEAIRRGAATVIPKTATGKSMMDILRAVVKGEPCTPLAVDRPAERDRGPPSAPTGSPMETLTRREREVLHFVAAGLTNKEIGERLGIEEVTVKLHLRGVFRKFGVSNRTQAVRIAHQYGWPP